MLTGFVVLLLIKGRQNNNVLALSPPPPHHGKLSLQISSPQYSPTHQTQVTQVVITTHQPICYNPQGGSPLATNNIFGMSSLQ